MLIFASAIALTRALTRLHTQPKLIVDVLANSSSNIARLHNNHNLTSISMELEFEIDDRQFHNHRDYYYDYDYDHVEQCCSHYGS